MEKQQISNETLLKERTKMMMEILFIGLISDLTNMALQSFGRLKNPTTNQFFKNIPQAEKMISILDMLAEKTKNSLTSMEKEHIKNSIERLKRIYYEESQTKEEKKPEEVISIRHILVESEVIAQDIMSQLKENADFGEMAKLHSMCNSRIDGGYIDEIKAGSLPKNLEDVIFKLKKDEISEITRTVLGYHIVKLIDKKTIEGV